MITRSAMLALLFAAVMTGEGRAAQAQPYSRDSLGADWRERTDDARQGVRQGRLIPLARVVDDLRRRQPGRQLDAGLETGPDGRPVYRVRWATDQGRRIDFLVDAETGAVISASGG